MRIQLLQEDLILQMGENNMTYQHIHCMQGKINAR
jgi:hypothetical protein